MGKITGFMELQRIKPSSETPAVRIKHWKEFVATLDDAQAGRQGARCMDCGIPFCNNGCPVNNLIPDWNDLVYRQQWRDAIATLHATNNFPEFTGRVCPAPCEAACTLNINDDAVGIKSIELAIVEHAWKEGWVQPEPPQRRTGKKVAVIGSGPAGLACAQQLARAGHSVTVFDKSNRMGGLLRYGIPDFKLDKVHIDRRLAQMEAEGVEFQPSTYVGDESQAPDGLAVRTPASLQAEFDAVVLAGGSETPRDLPVQGRELQGVHFAMDFLRQQNMVNSGDLRTPSISAKGKHVIVIGGGDTGSDCVGTSIRQGAASVTQFELMPRPPEEEDRPMTWPYWPLRLRTSSSHEEGCQRDWAVATKSLVGDKGEVKTLSAVRVEWAKDKVSGQMKMRERDDAFDLPADLVLLAMGFVSPVQQMLQAFGVDTDPRGNARAMPSDYRTSADKVFAAGDMRRGQSLVVWAIREGRQCARAVDAWLMGDSLLP